MIRPLAVAAGAAAAGGFLLAITVSPRPARAQVLSGFDLFRTNCVGCHDLPDPEDQKHSRKDWEAILTRMVKQRGATLSDREFQAVLNYVDSFNRPKREIQWVETPAKAHKAAFTATD